jgi:CRP-like cAMP-binding protein
MPARVRSGATKVDLIAHVPLFAGLSKSELGQVASIADEIDLPADKVLIREGERGREFFVLLEGEAEVTRKGKKLATRRAGEFFGEIALVSNLPRIATVKTRKPVRALVLRDIEFRALLQRAPTIAVKVLQAVADRLPPDAV